MSTTRISRSSFRDFKRRSDDSTDRTLDLDECNPATLKKELRKAHQQIKNMRSILSNLALQKTKINTAPTVASPVMDGAGTASTTESNAQLNPTSGWSSQADGSASKSTEAQIVSGSTNKEKNAIEWSCVDQQAAEELERRNQEVANRCPICWDDFDEDPAMNYSLACDHQFHTLCLSRQIGGRTSKGCVVCLRQLEHQELTEIRHAAVEAKRAETVRWQEINECIETIFDFE